MIKFLHGKNYRIRVLHTDTADAGHAGASRERLYLILSHKDLTEEVFNPLELYESIRSTMRSQVATAPADYLLSSSDEVLREATFLARKRHIDMRKATWTK